MYEWVHHHIQEGIDKFILIDDNSDDDYLECNDWLNEFIKSGKIEVHQSVHDQNNDYDRFIPNVKKFTWVIQIDLDEFIFNPSPTKNLKEVLASKYKGIDHIRIKWKMFRHDSIYQPKSVIENNLITHHENIDPSSPMGIKCIARTQYLTSIKIHNAFFSHDVETVFLYSHNPDIQINHYRTQSDEFLYGVKEKRGAGVYKNRYSVENIKNHICHDFSKHDSLLKLKRENLIQKCKLRNQVKPKIYEGSSWQAQNINE